jgi:hypothetical protein
MCTYIFLGLNTENRCSRHEMKGGILVGNRNDNQEIRSRSEKRAIESGKIEPGQKEFIRGNGSQNNRK